MKNSEDKRKQNPDDEEQMKKDEGTGLYNLAIAIGGSEGGVIASDNPGDNEEYNKKRIQDRLEEDENSGSKTI